MLSAADFSWHQVFCSDFDWLLEVLVPSCPYCVCLCSGHCYI